MKNKNFCKPLIVSLYVFGIALTACNGNGPKKPHDIEIFQNFVYDFAADVDVIRGNDGYFYCYGTSGNYYWNGPGTEKFYSYGPILRSNNLINWKWVGSVFDKLPSWGAAGSDVWAPGINYMNGKYYYYYTMGVFGTGAEASGIGVATSETPYGPWTDHGKICIGADVNNTCCIDAVVRQDKDGKIYMFYGSFAGNGTDYIELTDDGLAPKYKDQKYYGAKRFGSYFEGTYFIEHDGEYILMGSEGSCCKGLESTYSVVTWKSDTLLGDYTDKMHNDQYTMGSGTVCICSDSNKSKVKGPGHHGVIVDDDGVYWIVYHGFDIDDFGKNNMRHLYIDRLEWDEKGYPYVCTTTNDGEKLMYTSSRGYGAKGPYFENIHPTND